jgi:hypothetical protein
MNSLLFGLVALAFVQPAFSSDNFENQIVCAKVTQPGEADNGLEIIIQTNPTAWVKRAAIVENGYLAPREIGSFNIPLHQPNVSTPSFFNSNRIATYSVYGFFLTMEVADQNGQQVLGPAQAHVELQGYEPLEVDLTCKRVN